MYAEIYVVIYVSSFYILSVEGCKILLHSDIVVL